MNYIRVTEIAMQKLLDFQGRPSTLKISQQRSTATNTCATQREGHLAPAAQSATALFPDIHPEQQREGVTEAAPRKRDQFFSTITPFFFPFSLPPPTSSNDKNQIFCLFG